MTDRTSNPEIHGCTGKHGSQVECDIVVLGLRNIRDEPYRWSPPETKDRSPTGAELLAYGISIGVLPEGCDLLPYQFSAVFRRQIEAAWALRSPPETPAERECKCIPQVIRTWNYCTDCGGRIPSTLKTFEKPSAPSAAGKVATESSVIDTAEDSGPATVGAVCPTCKTELAFADDVCGLCNPVAQP